MTRTDIHRPSEVNPLEYDFVCYDYTGELGDWQYLAVQRLFKREHMARTGGSYSTHNHGGSCHVCGAHAIYTATFWHRASNVYIHTGLECAGHMEHSGGEAFRRRVHLERERQRGVAKAKEILFAKFANEEANRLWGLYNRPYVAGETVAYEEATIRDIVGRLVKYGNISENALRYLGTLCAKIDARAVQATERAAAQSVALPVPEGKMTLRGKVLSAKRVEGAFGSVLKMLVQHADGWKIWGSMPQVLSIQGSCIGLTVEFTATIERSTDDAKFGFFKRPTKARVLEEAGV